MKIYTDNWLVYRQTANNLLQPTVARAAWSSFVIQYRFVPLFSCLPASGRAMAAEQGRSAAPEVRMNTTAFSGEKEGLLIYEAIM